MRPLKESRAIFEVALSFAASVLLMASLAAGSNTALMQGAVFWGGMFLGAATYLFVVERATFGWPWRLLALVGFIQLTTLNITYNHPSKGWINLDGGLILTSSPLKGIVETVAYGKGLEGFKTAFTKSGCESRMLFVTDYFPMAYFITGRPAPQDIGVPRPAYYFPIDIIYSEMAAQSKWCILVGFRDETKVVLQERGELIKLEQVKAKIASLGVEVWRDSSTEFGEVEELSLFVRD